MKIFSELPFDVNPREMLEAVCQVERLQRPAKRSEKKTLNALHKDVRYKLEGAPSKVRVQQPWEKAFVLLQASIERRELDDYTLRSESVGMCDFASRMLSAAEEIGARATKNGQVVVHSLKLRRSIATSLWDHDGVLGQFSSLNNHVIKSLEFHGVKTFDDVLNATAESLEKAASCTAPFGSDLKNAVHRVVAGALKIEAKVTYHANGSPGSVLCNLRAIGDSSESRQSSSSETPDVTYTVVAYTDRPNGCLLYKRNVSKPEIFEFSVPPRFGKITIRLVASMVGLDGKYCSTVRCNLISPKGNLTILSSSQTLSNSQETMKFTELSRPSTRKRRRRSKRAPVQPCLLKHRWSESVKEEAKENQLEASK